MNQWVHATVPNDKADKVATEHRLCMLSSMVMEILQEDSLTL